MEAKTIVSRNHRQAQRPIGSARVGLSSLLAATMSLLSWPACSCDPREDINEDVTGIDASFQLDIELGISQIRVWAQIEDADGEDSFDPVVVPDHDAGPLGAMESVVIIFPDDLGGLVILLTAEGLAAGSRVAVDEQVVLLESGSLSPVTFVLAAPSCGEGEEEGSPCDDGNFCTINTTCDADGRCGGGEPTCPEVICATVVCDAVLEECIYENEPGGTDCGAGMICDGAGSCESGCWIDGDLFLAGESDPEDPCSKCSPEDSTDSWTLLAGDISSEIETLSVATTGQEWTVPDGVTMLEIRAWGAGGGGGGGGAAQVGGDGGGGGYSGATVPVSSGESLSIFVGGGGGGGNHNSRANAVGTGGGGGGFTGVLSDAGVLVLAAGGGGGGGGDHGAAAASGGFGGAGGGPSGVDGGDAGPNGSFEVEGGGGATATSPGAEGGVESAETTLAGPGDVLSGGAGGSPSAVDGGTPGGVGGQNGGGTGGLSKASGGLLSGRSGGGGGGAGYFGGGGGEAANVADASGAGGGGGSGFASGRNQESLTGSGAIPANPDHTDLVGEAARGGAGGAISGEGQAGADGVLIIEYFVCE